MSKIIIRTPDFEAHLRATIVGQPVMKQVRLVRTDEEIPAGAYLFVAALDCEIADGDPNAA